MTATSFVINSFEESSLKAKLKVKNTILRKTMQENEYLWSLAGEASNNIHPLLCYKQKIILITGQFKELVTGKEKEIEILQQKISILSMNETCASQKIKGGICSHKCLFIFVLELKVKNETLVQENKSLKANLSVEMRRNSNSTEGI